MNAKLVNYVVKSLIENISIAAESLTGGLFQSEITSVPGSSDIFTGGFVTYSDAVKTQLLNVPASLIQQYGVSFGGSCYGTGWQKPSILILPFHYGRQGQLDLRAKRLELPGLGLVFKARLMHMTYINLNSNETNFVKPAVSLRSKKLVMKFYRMVLKPFK